MTYSLIAELGAGDYFMFEWTAGEDGLEVHQKLDTKETDMMKRFPVLCLNGGTVESIHGFNKVITCPKLIYSALLELANKFNQKVHNDS